MSATVETSWKEKVWDSVEIPILTRCCFCFPLRKGLIVFAYVNLKQVLLMKIYLYFEIVFSVIGLIYGLAFMTTETASELFLILFQLMLQIYLVILIWSSIVKMDRDGTVKYTRERDPV